MERASRCHLLRCLIDLVQVCALARRWVVRVRATVTKDVFCENCTDAEARRDPYNHAENEEEVEQYSYEVIGVKPNK